MFDFGEAKIWVNIQSLYCAFGIEGSDDYGSLLGVPFLRNAYVYHDSVQPFPSKSQ
jgi:hypothetical protein